MLCGEFNIVRLQPFGTLIKQNQWNGGVTFQNS